MPLTFRRLSWPRRCRLPQLLNPPASAGRRLTIALGLTLPHGGLREPQRDGHGTQWAAGGSQLRGLSKEQRLTS